MNKAVLHLCSLAGNHRQLPAGKICQDLNSQPSEKQEEAEIKEKEDEEKDEEQHQRKTK